MPRGTKVDDTYRALLDKGYDKGKAARIAQSQTGQSLATGKKLREADEQSVASSIRQNMESLHDIYKGVYDPKKKKRAK